MSGEIHEDGAWINFRLKPANFRNNREKQREKKDKQGRRFLKFRPTKRCIINFSQRASNDEVMHGSSRTLLAMDYTENAVLVTQMNQCFVKAGSCVMSDENPAYNNLKLHYEHYSVNHQEAYSKCGVNNNLTESFNSRLRDLDCEIYNVAHIIISAINTPCYTLTKQPINLTIARTLMASYLMTFCNAPCGSNLSKNG